jgi:hypothetical protein
MGQRFGGTTHCGREMKSTGLQNMNTHTNHKQPALHNAMWPGLVGKGAGSEPPIDLDTMLKLTAAADVNGVKFDGADLFLTSPHTAIDSSDEDLKRLSDKIASFGLVIGSGAVWFLCGRSMTGRGTNSSGHTTNPHCPWPQAEGGSAVVSGIKCRHFAEF